jgi:predicted RNase H-like nuclease
MYLGVDGFRYGWVAITLDDKGEGSIEFLCDIQQLEEREYKMGMVDIPIGLPPYGKRRCDLAAKELLGPDRNRVFTGARRPLLGCRSHEEANRTGKSLCVSEQPGDGVSAQLFCILKKINEVDEFMNSKRQETLRETHPELVFFRLRGSRLDKKHSPKGKTQRRELLTPRIRNLPELVNERLGTGAKEDDVLDACACALAAKDCAADGQNVLPTGIACIDGKKLRMQIWY